MTCSLLKKSLAVLLINCIGVLFLSSCGINTAKKNSAANQKGPADQAAAAKAPELHPAFTIDNAQYGYINDSGQFVIRQQFDDACDFDADGFAMAWQGGEGILNTKGEWVVKPEYFEIDDFSDGAEVVVEGYDSDTAPITSAAFDESGKKLFTCKGTLSSFHDGLAVLSDNDGYIYVDKSGKQAIEEVFEEADDFDNGKAQVQKRDGAYYYIDKTGRVLSKVTPVYSSCLQSFDDGWSIAETTGGLYTLINNTGIAVIMDAASISRLNADYYAVEMNEDASGNADCQTAIFSKEGTQLTGYVYYDLNGLGNGMISAATDSGTVLLGEDLKPVKGFPALKGEWYLSSSGSLIQAILYDNIRYYTQGGKLVYQSDGDYTLKSGAVISTQTEVPNRLTAIQYPQFPSLTNETVQAAINEKLKKAFMRSDTSYDAGFSLREYSNGYL